jgi:hypothetical protein
MLRLEKSSSLRHIMSMCTDFLKANNGMMRTLAGTKLGVSCLESCLHQGVMQKLLAERELHICVLPVPKGHTEQNLSMKDK